MKNLQFGICCALLLTLTCGCASASRQPSPPPEYEGGTYVSGEVRSAPYTALSYGGIDTNPQNLPNTYHVNNDSGFVADIWDALGYDAWTEQKEGSTAMVSIKLTFSDESSSFSVEIDSSDTGWRKSAADGGGSEIYEYFTLPAGTYDRVKLLLTTYTSEHFMPEVPPSQEPEIIEADWAEYFNGLNGAAVLYDAANMRYTVFNSELAQTRRSPCSTFKIISSLIALENGVLVPEDSTRKWSGEAFWNEKWNRDIDFTDAFHESCVWYFRELTDDMGPEMVQEGLNKLQYGNCDISDWEGHLNTNNNNRALTGFWIESSLLISPKEQTEVMERIFNETSEYSEETRESLKQVMLVTDSPTSGISIYGKTGMGKSYGVTVDAWFTGFAEKDENRVYFCVYLGETDNMDVTSTGAKDIAIRLVTNYFDN